MQELSEILCNSPRSRKAHKISVSAVLCAGLPESPTELNGVLHITSIAHVAQRLTYGDKAAPQTRVFDETLTRGQQQSTREGKWNISQKKSICINCLDSRMTVWKSMLVGWLASWLAGEQVLTSRG